MGDAPRPPPGRTAPEPLFDFYSPETYKDYHGVLMVADDGTVAPWDGYDEQMHTMGLDETRDSSPTPSFCISAVDLPGIELSHESIAYLLRAESPSPSPPPLCGVPPPGEGLLQAVQAHVAFGRGDGSRRHRRARSRQYGFRF